VTHGFRLHAKSVLHSVGPIGVKPAVLASSFVSALDGAKANGARSVALCCISTGVYGYPIEQATPVALSTVRQWLERNRGALDSVIFCVFNPQDAAIYTKWMTVFFPST
jgi:O-acetyl-ADP-ribose deacetylase (regulator of RNase III)